MLNVRLFDRKTRQAQAIDEEGASLNIVRAVPPFGGEQKMRVLRQYLTTDGTPGGTNDMQVAASAAAPTDFFIQASETKDRYICMLSFAIADANATLNTFGTIAALTNGCRLFYSDIEGEVDIHDALKSNYNFIRLCQGLPSFGDATTAFRAANVAGNSEGYIPTLDLRRTFGFQWGVRLGAGTRQRITLRVRDDTTGVDQFDCIAYGFERAK